MFPKFKTIENFNNAFHGAAIYARPPVALNNASEKHEIYNSYFQFFSPLIFIQVPFYYSVLGPIVGLSQGLVTDLFPLLFAWSPVFNTFLIFILNSEIRSALIGKQRTSTTSDARRSVGGNQN